MSDLAGKRGPQRQVCPYCWLLKPSQVVFRPRGRPYPTVATYCAARTGEPHVVYRDGCASLKTLSVFLPLLPNLYNQLANTACIATGHYVNILQHTTGQS